MALVANEIEARGRFEHLDPIGVIDIGSNSVRLVVYEGATRSPTPLFNEKVLCGLGRSVGSTGKLGQQASARALEALARFRAISGILGVKELKCVATAAVREASDGSDFIRAGERVCGAPIQVLSGEREAELAAAGIQMGFQHPDGIAGDLGGGSLELVDIAGGKLSGATTLPLGGLRLIDSAQGSIEKALRIVDNELGKVDWLGRGKGRPFYAVGGTWRALCRLHMEHTDYPLRVAHGYSLKPKDALEFCAEVRKAKKLVGYKGIEAINRARRETLPFGALVMERLLEHLKPSEVIVSVFGVREGVLFEMLPAEARREDPLLSFCDDYAKLRSRSVEHAYELCDWTDVLFSAAGLDETPEERRLRHAACLVSDIGWRAHPDYRGEQSLNVIAHAALGGIDHAGRIFLALTVYYRHAGVNKDSDEERGKDELSDRLKSLVSKRTLRRARILGAAVRTAHMLSIGMPDVIPYVGVAVEKGRLALKLPRALGPLNGERLRRRCEVLASLLGLGCEIVLVD